MNHQQTINKMKITTEIDFVPFLIKVKAEPRFWEDAIIDGVPDTEHGEKIPFKSGSVWMPVIYFETGQVLNWPKVTADIHYKVCDQGEYYLEDKAGQKVKWKGDYVPG